MDSQIPNNDLSGLYQVHNGAGFLTPTDLVIGELRPRKVIFIGSCLMSSWGLHERNSSGTEVDLIAMNNAGELPSDVDPKQYDFQVIQLPLRGILLDEPLGRCAHDLAEAEKLLDECCARLNFQLQCRINWNVEHGLLTFVSNFFVPQRNPMGLLFPRYDLRNPEYFVERLNQHLEHVARTYRNAYVLDIDRISASIGRRYVQDDTITSFSHGAILAPIGRVDTRIEPMAPMTDHYDVGWVSFFREALWNEMLAMYRVVRQVDPVKLVIVDLDDTLWNGVSGDMPDISPVIVEGWPLGLLETLLFLKKRGVLLAIASKNEESRIREVWPKIFGERLYLQDFSAIKISWQPKAESVQEIIEGVNLLPRNVVFIDDNPVERAAMKAAFPDMRVIGQYPYYLRRILLWAPETQVPSITNESSKRTEMIQAQLERETSRKTMSREEFLNSAAPKITMLAVQSTEHPRFARCFELVNKTNQFNTTGKRWTQEDVNTFFAANGVVYAFEVSDNLTEYGLVGVIFTSGTTIEQWAMSCRVLGLEIEIAVMAIVGTALRSFGSEVYGKLLKTEVNFPCRDLFSKCGFVDTAEGWVLPQETELRLPSHIMIEQ